MEMNASTLRQVCKQRGFYITPQLNEQLYANFSGFISIGGLDDYSALKALSLEGNAIERLDGLPPLQDLKCLFLQGNRLEALDPCILASLPSLHTLNISGNRIACLDGLDTCCALRELMAAGNELASTDAVSALARCQGLESVDLQNNKLDDPQGLLAVLRGLRNLKCLYLRGNPFVSTMHNYRKSFISAIPGLTYLDDRPVFEVDRRCAEAWARGGLEGERQERARYMVDKEEREQANHRALQQVREEGFRRRREALGLRPGTTDPFLDTLDLSACDEAGEAEDEEPPELLAAQRRLAELQARKQGGRGAGGDGEDELPPVNSDDLAAKLAESRVQRGELLAGAADDAAAVTSPSHENAEPNAAMCEPAAATRSSAPLLALGVPAARQTVVMKAFSGSGLTCELSPGDCGEEHEPVAAAFPGLTDALLQSTHSAAEAGTSCEAAEAGTARSNGSASVVSDDASDFSEDDLDALD